MANVELRIAQKAGPGLLPLLCLKHPTSRMPYFILIESLYFT